MINFFRRRNNGGIPNQQQLVANDTRHLVRGDPAKLEKPTCLQLSNVNARQSTTSTITSDYFSMNSREAEANRRNREDDAIMDNRSETYQSNILRRDCFTKICLFPIPHSGTTWMTQGIL